MIGVAVEDTLDSSTAFAEEFDPAYDLAYGNREFSDAYPRLGLPVTYYIASDGTVEQIANGLVDQAMLEGWLQS